MNASPALRPSLLLLSAVSALVGVACSGFSSSETTTNAGVDGGVVTDATMTEDARTSDSGSTADATSAGFEEAGCSTNVEDGDSGGVKRMFVTSSVYTGAIASVAAADVYCNSIATEGSLGGRWHAWLSTKTCAAKDRFIVRERFLVDGGSLGQIGPNFAPNSQLNAAGYPNALNLGGANVWTGTNADGTANQVNCSAWTVGSSGTFGKSGKTSADAGSADWTAVELAKGGLDCAVEAHLYCFEL